MICGRVLTFELATLGGWRRVAPVSGCNPHHNQGAPGPSLLGTGEGMRQTPIVFRMGRWPAHQALLLIRRLRNKRYGLFLSGMPASQHIADKTIEADSFRLRLIG